MICNSSMYERDTIANVIRKVDAQINKGFQEDNEIKLSQDELIAIYGIIRNHYILTFGCDTDGHISHTDGQYYFAYQNMIRKVKENT